MTTKRTKILLVDTERGASGFKTMPNVVVEDCSPDDTQTAFEKADKFLLRLFTDPKTLEGFSHLVVDTVSSLFSITRHELIQASAGSLWSKRGLYASDPRGDYRATNDLMARLLQYYRKLPVPTVFVAHEDERVDPSGAVLRGPAVSPGLLKDLIGWSHVVAHLGIVPKDVKLAGGEVIRAGTRRLRVAPDGRYMVKARRRVDLAPLPPVILTPHLADLLDILAGTGEPNAWAVIYGPPGVGKTSLTVGAEYKESNGGPATEAVVEEEKEATAA